MKFMTEKDGVEVEIETIVLDGYSFGDRLLEGVLFDVTNKNGKLTAKPHGKSDARYLDDLNAKKWLKACVESIECPDELAWAYPLGGKNGDMVWTEEDNPTEEIPEKPGVQVPMKSFNDFLGGK